MDLYRKHLSLSSVICTGDPVRMLRGCPNYYDEGEVAIYAGIDATPWNGEGPPHMACFRGDPWNVYYIGEYGVDWEAV
jgi:hypothetical protein